MEGVKIADVLPEGRELVTVDDTADVGTVLEVLGMKNLTSMPVLSKGVFSGFVDYLDLLSFLVEVGSEVHESHVTPPSHSIKTDDVSMILERANAFKLHSVRETKVKNKSRHDPSVAVSLQDSLSSALKLFALGFHRVVVNDVSGRMVSVLTQSDILAWAAKQPEKRVTHLERLAMEFMTGVDGLQIVCDTDVAIDAFMALESSHNTGAPILDDEGKLVGCLSSSDLKQLNHKSFLQLLEPLKKWMNSKRLLWVSRNTSLGAVVKRMADWRTHRVFVVDNSESMQLVGVISLSDVLKQLAH